jgi:hypothetical protein
VSGAESASAAAMLASQLRDSIVFSPVQLTPTSIAQRPAERAGAAGVKCCRKSTPHAARRTDLVNNVFIRLTAVLATLAHPGTAFANPGIAPIAATAAPA